MRSTTNSLFPNIFSKFVKQENSTSLIWVVQIFLRNIFQVTGVTLRFICISHNMTFHNFLEKHILESPYHNYSTILEFDSHLNHQFSVYRSCLYLCLKKKLCHPEQRSQFQQSMKGSLLQVWSHLPGWRDWMGFPALPSGMKTAETAAQLWKEKSDTGHSQGETPEHWEKLCFILTTLIAWK